MKEHNLKKVVLSGVAILLTLICSIFFVKNDWARLVILVSMLVLLGTAISGLGKNGNSTKVVLVTILVFLLLTWVLPAAYYSGEYVDQGRVQMGLFDLFNYPLTALSYFGYIGLFIVLVGGFYGILYKIPAYRTFLDGIVKAFKGHEAVFISIVVVVMSLIVSFCGVQFGIALFIPFIATILTLMGYDKIVAVLTIVGSISVGLIGSTYAPSNTSILIQSFGLKTDYQFGVRLVILLVGVVLVIFNTLMYIKNNKSAKVTKKEEIIKEIKEVKEEVVEKVEKVAAKKAPAKKKTTTKSTAKKTTTKKSSKSSKSVNKAALIDEDVIVVPNKVSDKHSIWPFVVLFILMFVLFVLAYLPWGDSGFKVKLFDDITKTVQEFKLFGFPIFAKVLGTINSFGNWSITDLFMPMGLTILLLVLIYKVKAEDVFEGFVNGAKKALGPAFIAVLLYAVLVLVTYHPFQAVIYKAVLGLSKGFNVATTVVTAILAGFFNSDATYSFQSVIPYYTSIVTNKDTYEVAAIIFQAMYGLAMLVAPTSLCLMGVLSYLKVDYKDWLKNVWKLLLELFIVLLIIFIILAL